MKLSHFLIFLTIALSVYGSINYYIFVRGWQAIPKIPLIRIIYTVFFLLIFFSYIAGRIAERFKICAASEALIWIGSFWLAIMIYLFLSILIIDIIRILNRIFNFFPAFITYNYEKTKLIAAGGTLIISLIITLIGFLNACSPVIKKLDLTISKKVNRFTSLHIAMASDIHLGIIISNSRLEKLVDTINELNPDIVLLAGDIVDEDLAPVIKNNLGETLLKLKSKYGTYAVTGNHEYIGGAEAAIKYLAEHNIHVLKDKVVKIDNKFYITGRDDLSSNRYGGGKRNSLANIIKDIDHRLPVILMDHQPFNLPEATENKVDLQFSGHTHHGQLWPFNFITSKIYELSAGYKKIAGTHFYVSAGYGTWGPPVRTSSRPEIVSIHLRFKD